MSATGHDPSSQQTFASPDDALNALCQRLRPVALEVVPFGQAGGRVLAAPAPADRDSPPCDVSAMDGYAVRLVDLARPVLEVAGEAAVGQSPPRLPPGKTLRIFTGAPVPPEAEAVIRREDVREEGPRIVLGSFHRPPVVGLYIRRRGENLRADEAVLPAGPLVTPAVVAALASFGATSVSVRRKVRVGIISTGSELVAPHAPPQPWQIRDSNGPGLAALLAARAWLDVRPPVRVSDDYEALRRLLADSVAACDAVLLTGGVSAGQYDFVPDVVTAIGGETILHRLPIRPGAPILGAVGPQGQAILGLPGNPVSVMITARRFGGTVLRHLAGLAGPCPWAPVVRLSNPDDQTLKMWRFRLVRRTAVGLAELVPTRGSGDVVSLGRSDGFVEVPPEMAGAGPWAFYSWEG